MPDVPTIAEAGVPDYQINAFHGILAPAGTPPAIVARLEKDITEVLKSPAVNQKLIDLGFDPVAGVGAELAAIIDRDLPVWRDVVQGPAPGSNDPNVNLFPGAGCPLSGVGDLHLGHDLGLVGGECCGGQAFDRARARQPDRNLARDTSWPRRHDTDAVGTAGSLRRYRG